MRIDIDTCEEILITITRNKTRSLLTAFGVFWGIFMLESVVAATRTPARLSGFVICCRIFCFTHCYSSRIFIDESLKKLTESLYQLFHYERLAFYLIELMQVNTFHFHAEIACQLSHILLGYHDGLVFP